MSKLQYQSTSKVLFVAPTVVTIFAVFSSFSQPLPAKSHAQQAQSVSYTPQPAQQSALVFSQFSVPQYLRGNLPDEQPSTLFEVAPPRPVPFTGFAPFGLPQFMRTNLPDEQPSALFEILPPQPTPFTGFAQFQPVISVKPIVALFVPASGWIPPPIPPEPPPEPYVPHGGGFGGGWNYSDGWGYNSNKRIRKPGEPLDPVEADDIRELILDAIGRPKPKRIVIPPPILLPPDPAAMQALAQWLMQAEQARIVEGERRRAELADEDDIEVLMLGMM